MAGAFKNKILANSRANWNTGNAYIQRNSWKLNLKTLSDGNIPSKFFRLLSENRTISQKIEFFSGGTPNQSRNGETRLRDAELSTPENAAQFLQICVAKLSAHSKRRRLHFGSYCWNRRRSVSLIFFTFFTSRCKRTKTKNPCPSNNAH